MSKRTITRTARQYDAYPVGKIGGVQRFNYVKRDIPLIPIQRKEMIVYCGDIQVVVMVSQGQIINKEKVCKKLSKI